MCSRNGMLEIHLLPKKGVGKEISALKVRFLQNSWLTTSCLLGRCSRGWLWVLNLWFPHHSRFLQHLAELGKDGKGSLTCPAGVWIWVSLLKQLHLLKEPKFLHFFWQLTTIHYLFIYYFLFIILTLLMVFSKWESQVLWVAAISRSIGRVKQSSGFANPSNCSKSRKIEKQLSLLSPFWVL